VRIIKQSHLRRLAGRHPRSASAAENWLAVAKQGRWGSLTDVRRTFPHADAVTVASGNTVTIFNIAGNQLRLITAIHYRAQLVFILRLLTHAEYSKNTWKEQL